jgi:hypothetical protein
MGTTLKRTLVGLGLAEQDRSATDRPERGGNGNDGTYDQSTA